MDDGVPRFAMNHPYSLLDAIREKDNNVYLNEALLKTWSIDAAIKHFKHVFKEIVPHDLQDLTFDDLYDSPNNTGKLVDYCQIANNDGLIVFVFPFNMVNSGNTSGLCKESEKLLKKFVDAMFVTGYFLSFAGDMKPTDKMMKLGIGLCSMQFEARYSRKVAKLSKILYHVSPSRYFNKIAKHGIVPKSNSLNLKYPDRVYLFNNTAFSLIRGYGLVKSLQLL